MLSALRDRRGGPNGGMGLLAVGLALLLAAPLTAALREGALRVLSAVL